MADEKNQNETPQDELQDDDQNETQDAKLQCGVEIEDTGVWKKKIVVTIPRSEINKEQDSQYGELMTSAEVPGFRKGRAPKRLVEKRFGEEIGKQTKLKILANAFEIIDDKYDFDILGEPDLDIDKIELPEEGDLTFDYEIEVKPEFELPELEGIKIERPFYEVTDEQIDEQIDNMQRRMGKMEDVEGAAAKDDFARGDVTMNVEGIDEPQTQSDTLVRVGSTAMMGVTLDDMGKTLKGAKAGDTKTCTADVPDTHAIEELRGKKAKFTIEVKGVKRLVPAALDEEFFSRFGVGDEKELRQRIEEELESQSDREIRKLMSQRVQDYLAENIDFDLPEGIASRHAATVLQRQYYQLLQQGIPQEQIVENIEKLRASVDDASAKQLKMTFIMSKIADGFDITVTQEEINGFVARVAATYGRRPERVRDEMEKEGRLAELQNAIREEKTIERILEMAEVVDAPPKSEKITAEKKTAKDTKSTESAKSTKSAKAKADKATETGKTKVATAKKPKAAAKKPKKADSGDKEK